MDPYLNALLEYFQLYHVGENWLTDMDHILRWTQSHTEHGSVWIEVVHHVKQTENLFVHIATNNPNEVARVRALANIIPDAFLNHQVEIPKTAQGWARVGYYLLNPEGTNEWFTLISHIVNFLAIKNLINL